MADFNERFSPSYSSGPSDNYSGQLTGAYRHARLIRNDARIASEFPSQGSPQPSHLGSQSQTPPKDLIDRLDDIQGQIEDRR